MVQVSERARAAGCPRATRTSPSSPRSPAPPSPAGGRWLGVIFADRGGEPFELERRRAPTPCGRSGKTAALAASVARSRPASTSARAGCSRRGSTSRGRSTSASCSACSASRWRSAPSTASSDEDARALRGRDAGGARRPARRARAAARAGGAGHRRHAARRARAARPPATRTCRSSVDWQDGRGGARRARAARAVGARRGAAQRRQARATRRACDVDVAARRRRLRARGPQRRRRRGSAARHRAWGCGWPPWRRSSAAALVEFGPRRRATGACAWWCPASEARTRRVSPERNLRVLVVDDHDVVHWGFRLLLGRAALGRALPGGHRRWRRRSSWRARYEPARGARGPVPRRGVGRRAVRGDPARVARHARAADLGRRLDLAAGGARPPARRASSPRTAPRRRRGRRRCAMVGRGHDRVRAARGAARRRRSRSASARCSR